MATCCPNQSIYKTWTSPHGFRGFFRQYDEPTPPNRSLFFSRAFLLSPQVTLLWSPTLLFSHPGLGVCFLRRSGFPGANTLRLSFGTAFILLANYPSPQHLFSGLHSITQTRNDGPPDRSLSPWRAPCPKQGLNKPAEWFTPNNPHHPSTSVLFSIPSLPDADVLSLKSPLFLRLSNIS